MLCNNLAAAIFDDYAISGRPVVRIFGRYDGIAQLGKAYAQYWLVKVSTEG